MKRSPHIARGMRFVAAASASVIFPHLAFGGLSLTSGTYTITHDPDNAAATSNKTASGALPVSGSMPTPGTYQYGLKTISNTGGTAVGGGPQSSADGSVGAITTAATVGFTFASGSGVTQTDPSNNFAGQSQLRFNIDATWTVTAGGLGPTTYGYLAFTLGGVIPPNDSAEVVISNLRWYNPVNNVDYRTPITSRTLDFPPLGLPYTYTNQATLPTLGVGAKIEVSGIIDIRAQDPGATINVTPLNFEASAAPPTWTFTNKSSQEFTDGGNWDSTDTDNGTNLGDIPNAPGVRARFIGSAPPFDNPASDAIPVSIDQPITLGMLDLDLENTNFSGVGSLTMANDPSSAGECVIYARNTHDYLSNSLGHVFNIPVTLTRDTEIINECTGPLTFLQPISGAGGIIKDGQGPLMLGATNTFAGGIIINQGSVIATAGGASWGLGPVHINANSQAALDGGPGGATFIVGDLGCISGASTDLSQLTVGANLILPAAGGHAIIGHQTFDTGTLGNPVGLSPSSQQIFGISADFNDNGGTETLAIGNLAGGLWSGFASDNQVRTFGSSPTSGTQSITVLGDSQIVVPSNELLMNAPIKSGSGVGSITKLGAGLLAIENVSNTYVGLMTVQSGGVAIDGTWNVNAPTPSPALAAPLGSQINVSADAALGGTGTIKSNVDIANNAHFQPGTLTAIPSSSVAPSIPTTLQGPGQLSIVGDLTLHSQSQLDYDLDTPASDSDLVSIIGNLTLDGVLNVKDGPNFNENSVYLLISYTGTFTDHGLQLSSDFQNNYPLMQVVNIPGVSGGGTVLLEIPPGTVPEPGTIALIGFTSLIGLRQRRRTKNWTPLFAPHGIAT